MLNGRLLDSLSCLGAWRSLGHLTIIIIMTTNQVSAHDSPTHLLPPQVQPSQVQPSHAKQGNTAQDLIISQLTTGVSSEQRHGPVRSGETLSSIAKQRAPKNSTRAQYMDLIFQLNPHAFIHNNRHKLKVNSLLTLPGYDDNHRNNQDTSIAKQHTKFNDQQLQVIEYDPLLRVKSTVEADIFVAQVPIRVIAPNKLTQEQKKAKLQAQMQQTSQHAIHEQITLLQQINELEQQLTMSDDRVTELHRAQQILTVKNKNLLLQLKDLHAKYDHIINNYIITPKF